jgi:hypothetical protein
MGTWIVASAGKSYERLSANWFGNPSNTLEQSFWIHIPVSEVTLLLRFGIVVSTVGWNVLGLQPIGVFFINISALYYGIIYLYMNVFRYVFIYHLIKSLEYAFLLVIDVHVVILVREKIPRVGLKVAYPSLWVVGVCYMHIINYM